MILIKSLFDGHWFFEVNRTAGDVLRVVISFMRPCKYIFFLLKIILILIYNLILMK